MNKQAAESLKEKIRARRPIADQLRSRADEAVSKAKKVEEEIRDAEKELHTLRCEAFMQRLTGDPDLIDILAPSHSRSSCNDENHGNAERQCTRCRLLDLKEAGWLDPDSAHFEFRV